MKSVKIQGVRTEKVEVEVTPKELLRGIEEFFGLGEVFSPGSNYYWKWDETGNTLIEMEDTSRHGIPHDERTGRVITKDKSLKAYILLTELHKLMEEKDDE